MPIIAMPNGDQVSFPDDMPADQIRGLIAKKFPQDVSAHLSNMAQGIQSGMSWGQVAGKAASNIPSSAVELAKATAQPFLHPIQTAESLKDIGMGVLEKMGTVSGNEHVKYADAVGKFLSERYGGIDNLKNTIAKDPMGFLADASMLLSGGGTAAARVPGAIGKVGEVAQAAGRLTDPIRAAGKTVELGGKAASELIGQMGTHTGSTPIRTATAVTAQAPTADVTGKLVDYYRNLSKVAPASETVNDARNAVQQMGVQRGELYRQSMKDIGKIDTPLDFNKIDKAVEKVAAVKMYKEQVISTETQGIRQKLLERVATWKALDPKEYHTPEGLDALKQQIGEIRDATDAGSPAHLVANSVYSAIHNTITAEAPEYAKIMKGYEEASNQIKEINKTLSLNKNATVDTALRKLQSTLRDDVNTSYGRRKELADFIVKSGATNLMEKLAGQAMSSLTPRGMGRLGIYILEAMAGGVGYYHGGGHEAMLAMGAALPFMSPLAVGAAAPVAGALARPFYRLPARQLGQSAFQVGRLPQQQ